MADAWIECKECEILPSELKEYSDRKCRLCGALRCDECLNEAGLCTSCSENMNSSMDDAIPV